MSSDTSLVDLLVRTVVAMGIVLAIVAVAYAVAKRRGAPAARAGRRRHRRSTVPGVEVVGRVGLGRNAGAVAVRFGDRVVLVATSESGTTTTLAEMPAAEWDELHTVREPLDDLVEHPSIHAGTPRIGFVEALRQATARHA